MTNPEYGTLHSVADLIDKRIDYYKERSAYYQTRSAIMALDELKNDLKDLVPQKRSTH